MDTINHTLREAVQRGRTLTEYGPAKTLYNRWKRWSDNGVFVRIMVGLAAESTDPKTIMIDATYLKAHRKACSLRAKKRDALARSVEQKAA